VQPQGSFLLLVPLDRVEDLLLLLGARSLAYWWCGIAA
jgi:hypothetical protein